MTQSVTAKAASLAPVLKFGIGIWPSREHETSDLSHSMVADNSPRVDPAACA
jgi:hypothetical protein